MPPPSKAPQISLTSLLLLEGLWWLVTVAVCYLILQPILEASPEYPFLAINVIFMVVFITFFRHIFFLPYTFLAHQKWVKIVLIFVSPVLVFSLISNLNHVITFIDEHSIQYVLPDLSQQDLSELGTYVKTQIMLSGVGSILVAIILPFRLMLSLWRVRNSGTV